MKLGIEQPLLDSWTIYLSNLPGLDKKVRVAFHWTLDLLFPKDVCVVHDLPHRCYPDRMAPINNGVSSTDIKLLGANKLPDLAATMEEPVRAAPRALQ